MGGTTDEIMIPRTSAASTLPIANRLRNRTPYSSTVWVMTVATRQCASRRGTAGLSAKPETLDSYTPSTVLVLPTSRTRSILPPRHRAYASGNYHAQAAIGAHTKKAAGIKPVRNALVSSVFIHVHELSLSVRRSRLYPAHDGFKTQSRSADRAAHGAQQGTVLAIQSADQGRHNLHARPFFA